MKKKRNRQIIYCIFLAVLILMGLFLKKKSDRIQAVNSQNAVPEQAEEKSDLEQEEELLWMFQDLFKCPMSDHPDALAEAYLAWEEGKTLESALYLTVTDHSGLEDIGLVRERIEVMDLRGDGLEDQE